MSQKETSCEALPELDTRESSNNPAVTTPADCPLPSSGDESREASPPERQESARLPGQGFSTDYPTKYDVGWRRVVRHFSPSWFAVTMGTGIVAVLLISIPFKAQWLYYLSIVFFVLNTVLFALALATSILRYSLYPEIWTVMIQDPVNSLFLATMPMGLATLIEMWVFVCVPLWGPWARTFAWALWMVDSVIAVAVTVFLSFFLVSRDHIRSLDKITAAQLLPIAATIVAAGTGSEVAEVLQNNERALGTLIACYVLWGMGTPLAMAVLVVYYQRLAVHKIPPREVIVSSFLPLGPLGFGGYGIMYLGKVSRGIFQETNALDPMAGSILYVLGFFVAIIMWGFGLVWFCLALASIYQSRPFPFNMGWWGFTFPLGVFAASTIQLGIELSSMFFRVLGTIFATAVILLWAFVAFRTVKGAWSGKLFFAPCVANLKPKEVSEDLTSKAA